MNSSFSKFSYHPLFPLFLYASVCASQVVNHSLYLTTFLSFILSLSLYKTNYLIASLLFSSFFISFLSYIHGGPVQLLLFLLIMWSFRRAVVPITKRSVNQPRGVRMMSNDSSGGFNRLFGKASLFYNANKGVLNVATGALITLAGVGILTSFNVRVMPQLEPTADSVLRAFEEGRGLEPFDVDTMVDRKDLVNSLIDSVSKTYVVIVGKNGTGKTTVVRQGLYACKSPKGAVYFNCPIAVGKFSIELASLIDFHDGGAKRRTETMDEPLETFTTLIRPLTDAAAKFNSKHGRPMVLVIDSVDRIAETNPDFLGDLQDFAKDCADNGNLRFVFISSDGSTLPLMMANRSSWSRADEPYEVGEIPDDQAVEFLMKNGISEDMAKRAVTNLTGGLFVSLNKFVTSSTRGMTYEHLVEQRDRALRGRLLVLKVSPNHALFRQLVKHATIGMDDALGLGMEKAQLDVLLKDKILAAHPNETYTFHDRHTAMWFSREVKKTACLVAKVVKL